MMTDEAQPPSSSSSDANIPPPEPDPPPNIARMSSPSPSQASQQNLSRSRAHSSGTSEDNQSSSPNSSSTPAWVRWSRGLASLLDDQQGRDLFETYLEQEGCSVQLHFLWACKGLNCTALEDPPKIPQLVRTLYRHFFQNATLLGISDSTRSDLAATVKEGRLHEVGLFDKAEEEVQIHMQDNLYPNFLKSEIYLSAVNGEEESSNLQEQLECPVSDSSPRGRKSSLGDSSSLDGGDEVRPSLTTALEVNVVEQKSYNNSGGQSPRLGSPPLSTVPSVLLPNMLQTVHEDKELSVSQQGRCSKAKFVGLTKEALEKTEKARAKIPIIPPIASTSKFRAREPFTTSHFHQKPSCSSSSAPLHPYHASYSSYNPVSRVDSEIQSMSSDAMTEDGSHSGRGHSSARQHGAQNHRSRGQNMPSSSSSHAQQHHHHHAHSSRDASRRIVEQHAAINPNRDNLLSHPAPRQQLAQRPQEPAEFARQLIAKLEQVRRDREREEMLNQRLSEVDVVVPKFTGACGGGIEHTTPQNVLAAAINKIQIQDEGLQPDEILDQHMSRVFSDNTPNNRSPHLRSPIPGRRRGGSSMPRARRERDVISTVSGDSGNVHDLYPADMLPPSMSNSRSIPNDLRLFDHVDFVGVGASRHRVSRGGVLGHGDSRNVPLPLITRKTSSEFIDSGISMVSGATLPTNQQAPVFPCDRPSDRVQQWMEGFVDDRSRPRSTTSPPMMRRNKKPAVPPHAPPMMGMMGAGLADEVCKRLGKKTGIPPAILATQSVQVPLGPMSSSSANAIVMRHHSPPTSDESSASTKEHFVSSFVTYEDSQVPYVVKIPCQMFSGNPYITLAMFKEHLPKRGNYRYFFKRECAEVHANVVHEEITDDTQELPLYGNKIVAHLQAAVVNRGTAGTFTVDKI